MSLRKPVNSSSSHTWRAGLALLAVVVVVNAVVVGMLSSLFPGLSLERDLPEQSRPQSATPVQVELPPAPPPLQRTPSHDVLDAVFAASPEVFKGWTPVEANPARSGVPFALSCTEQVDRATAATVVRSQRFRSGDQGAMLQVWAYGAGQGALSFDRIESGLRSCSVKAGARPYTRNRSGLGVDALTAVSQYRSEGVSWVLWRRGDVLASVTLSSLASAPSAESAADLGTAVDGVLERNLVERCASVTSSVGEASRSPYGTEKYSPTSRTVSIVTPPVLKAESLGFTPPPTQVFNASLPSVQIARPDPFVSREPKAPAQPLTVPVTAEVRIPVEDKVGPGCGWAFTGQTQPVFDVATIEKTSERAFLDAQRQLAAEAFVANAAQMRWQLEDLGYQQQLAHHAVYRSWLTAYETSRAEERRLAAIEQARIDAERRAVEAEERRIRREEERLREEEEQVRREEEERLNPKPSPTPAPTKEPSTEPSPQPTEPQDPKPTEPPDPEPTLPPVTPPPSPAPSSPAPEGATTRSQGSQEGGA